GTLPKIRGFFVHSVTFACKRSGATRSVPSGLTRSRSCQAAVSVPPAEPAAVADFVRRRAACTGIIGCAASGAPLEASRPWAACSLRASRWDDTESQLARLSRVLRCDQRVVVMLATRY